MFFATAKFAELFIAPTNSLMLLALAGLALWFVPRTLKFGRRLFLASGALLGLCALLPVGDLMMDALQSRFPRFSPDAAPVAGIIVLGGAVALYGSADDVRTQPTQAVDRLFETVRLAKAYPNARVLVSAGPDHVVGATSEADAIAAYLVTMGVGRDRLLLERRSRNTFENARLSAAMVQPRPAERWLLVTSAWHMPRAVGCFRNAGFTVTAAPSDWQGGAGFGSWSASHNLSKLDLATKEYLGLLVYWLSGKTSALVPSS